MYTLDLKYYVTVTLGGQDSFLCVFFFFVVVVFFLSSQHLWNLAIYFV